MNEDSQYLVLLENEQFGPYSLDVMREMQLLPDTWVKNLVFGDDFYPASSFPELRDYLVYIENCQPEKFSVNLNDTFFYYREDGEMYGPLSLWELSLLDINDNSELSIDNMQTWTSAINITGLIETLRHISGEEERAMLDAERQQMSLDKDELEDVIKEQERELLEQQKEIELLKQKEEENKQKREMELELLQLQPQVKEQQYIECSTFDFASDYRDKYISLEKRLVNIISSFRNILPKDEKFVKVFQSYDDEIEYNLESYWRTIDKLGDNLEQIKEIINNATTIYNEDLQLLDASLLKLQNEFINQFNKKNKEALEESKNQIRELENITLSSKAQILSSLKRELADKKLEIECLLNNKKQEETLKINQIKSEISTLYHQLLGRKHQIEEMLQKINNESSKFFEQSYSMASVSSEIWNKIENPKYLAPTHTLLGCEKKSINIGRDKILEFRKRVFFDFLNSKHLLLRYNKETKDKAENFVNTLIGRLLISSFPGNVQFSVVDVDDMCGTSNILTRLNRLVYNLCVKNDDVRKIIDWMKDHIADIKVNLLLSPINSLQEYNQKKENKEAYQVLVIKGFPFGFGGDLLFVLNSILRNGISAGVNVIMLVNEDDLNKNEDTKKLISHISDDVFQHCSCIDFINNKMDTDELCDLDVLPAETLTNIVNYVNKGFEIREDEKVLLADYLPTEENWWSFKSAHHADIPFGVTDDKQMAKLKITQESGQNSAVVIGIPGSGKSVFLHSIICNAIVNYSPEELNLYLIDFSGVEFNTYANHKLPHAKVIAPEAEREFGLSILTELVEEGNRRMALCRDNNVSNIVDLKARHPELVVPRLLVIIDEFQKIFEIENDSISRDANSKIHIIIQEFRKFGINLILATQRLPTSSILPKDLIANRVVFKSSANDFSALINLPSTLRMPQLRTGECIYNSESGSQYNNSRVQGFFISMNDINVLLDKVSAHDKRMGTNSPSMTVFRGNDLPDFSERRIDKNHCYISDIPNDVGVYLGESIAINETDVCAVVRKETGNNIIVIGGESHVAQRIAYYATLSITTAHTNQSAIFYVFNHIRGKEEEIAEMNDSLLSLPFIIKMGNKMNEVMEYLTEIQEEIEARKNDEMRTMNHIYLSFYAFQLARMFDRGGRRGDDISECGKLLDFILRNGPTYGVFTILQVDNLESLSRIGAPINVFNYRIALQMSENDSNKVLGSSIANKIFVFNRPSSKYRAYFRDNNRNLTIKFKPYK